MSLEELTVLSSLGQTQVAHAQSQDLARLDANKSEVGALVDSRRKIWALLKEGDGYWNKSGWCPLHQLKTQNLSFNVFGILDFKNHL